MGGGRKGREGGGKAMNQKSYAFRKNRGDQIRKEEIGVASIFGEKFLGGVGRSPKVPSSQEELLGEKGFVYTPFKSCHNRVATTVNLMDIVM